MVSDWTYIVEVLKDAQDQVDLERILRADDCCLERDPANADLALAFLSIIRSDGGVRMIKNDEGQRLVYAMNRSNEWRVLAILSEDGGERVVLQKAWPPGPYYVGAGVTETVRRLADCLKVVEATPQDFLWFAPDDEPVEDEFDHNHQEEPAPGWLVWLRRVLGV